MKHLLPLIVISMLLFLMCCVGCQKEINSCGKVTGKGSILNIHGTYLEIDGVRIEVDLRTYSQYQIGDNYCQ